MFCSCPRTSAASMFRSARRTAWAALAALVAALLVVCLLPAAASVSVASGTAVSGAAAGTARAAPAGDWSWPLRPDPAITRSFVPPPRRWLAGHRGVDLAAAAGQEVQSPAAGTVLFSAVVVDRGVLTVDHGNGLVSSFEPVTATAAVGDHVTAGQTVALLSPRDSSSPASGGSAGSSPDSAQPHCPGSCLHWGVRLDGEYVDPLRFVMDRRPSVLLPVSDGSPAR